jgi:CRISPR-associated endonuclease Cas2
MYVILVYDFGEKRVNKMLKLCRKYLNWIQNSVFEGEISEAKLKELLCKVINLWIRMKIVSSSSVGLHRKPLTNRL